MAGHTGLVGSAIIRELNRTGYNNIITTSFDLRNQDNARWFIDNRRPEYVFMCAAHAGGILEAIKYPTEMLLDNLRIQNNVIEACYLYKVKKLLFLGSSCIYPVDGKQPYKEDQIGTGKTDENWAYAVAKLAGIELCRAYHRQYGCNFITAVPCNLYGPNDNFDLKKAHVIPALIRKFHEGGVVEIWGDGLPKREFLYVDDFAEAALMLMGNYDFEDLVEGVINVGSGEEINIDSLKVLISNTIKNCTLHLYASNKPTGVPSKLMDSSCINALGWHPETSLEDGIRKTYSWYKENCTEGSF